MNEKIIINDFDYYKTLTMTIRKMIMIMLMFFRYYCTPRKEYEEDYEDDDNDTFLSPASTQEGVVQIHYPPFKD